jgi:hypothetical protein
MQVVVNNTDITNYIVEGSYKMDSNDVYESWKDGNMREHRVIVAQKISGAFQVVCSNRSNSITLQNFLAIWNGAVDNGVVTLGAYVLDTNSFELLEAYYDIENVKHDRAGDGSFIDVLKITITER